MLLAVFFGAMYVYYNKPTARSPSKSKAAVSMEQVGNESVTVNPSAKDAEKNISEVSEDDNQEVRLVENLTVKKHPIYNDYFTSGALR